MKICGTYKQSEQDIAGVLTISSVKRVSITYKLNKPGKRYVYYFSSIKIKNRHFRSFKVSKFRSSVDRLMPKTTTQRKEKDINQLQTNQLHIIEQSH